METAQPQRVEWTVDLQGEVAMLTANIEVALAPNGPSLLELETDPERSRATLRHAEVEFAGEVTRAKLQAPASAKESFDAFVYALRAGSKPGVTSSGGPAAAVLAEEVSSRFGKFVRAAFPCDPLGRPGRVTLRYATLGTPVAGGIRFAVPPLDLEVVDDIPNVDEVIGFQFGAIKPALFASNSRPQRRDGRRWAPVSHRPEERHFTIARPEGNRLAATGGYAFVESEKGGVTAIAAGLSLPSPLTTLKGPAHLIFVVDKSASFGDVRQGAAFALAHGIFREAPPHSHFSVVEFGRHASYTSVREDDGRTLLARSMTPRSENGSALIDALNLARRLGGDGAEGETTRVVVMTDLEQAPTVTRSKLREAFARQPAVTHLVQFDDAINADAVRIAAFSFARLKSPSMVDVTGGIAVHLSPAELGHNLAARQSREARRNSGALLMRHLLSPQLVENIALAAKGMPSDHTGVFLAPDVQRGELDFISTQPLVFMDGDNVQESSFPSAMAPGENVRVLAALRGRVRQPQFFGTLWSDRVALPLTVAPAVREVVPGVVANLAAVDLSADEGEKLSRQGHAVSRFLSLLGLPSWRPPVVEDRIEQHSLGGWGCGCGGCGGHGFSTSCAGIRLETRRYESDLLAQRLREAVSACKAAPKLRARIAFESLEILDVTLVGNSEDVISDRAKACVTQALWRTSLDELVERALGVVAGDEKVTNRDRQRQFRSARSVVIAIDSVDKREPSPIDADALGPVLDEEIDEEIDEDSEEQRASDVERTPVGTNGGEALDSAVPLARVEWVRGVPMRP